MAGQQPHDLRRALSSYVASLCACLEAARDVAAVAALLQQAKALLLLGGGPNASHEVSASALTPEVAARQAGTALADHHAGWTARSGDEAQQCAATLATRAQAVRSSVSQNMQPNTLQLVFWGTPFAELAAVLLSGAARLMCAFPDSRTEMSRTSPWHNAVILCAGVHYPAACGSVSV